MGVARGQCKALKWKTFMTPSWWWPAAWKACSHSSQQFLSSRLRWPRSGWEVVSAEWAWVCCVWGGVLSTLLISLIMACAVGRNKWRGSLLGVNVCEKVKSMGAWYHPPLIKWERDSIFPVCVYVWELGVVWQSNIGFWHTPALFGVRMEVCD